ncbi:MAG: hypothetical protein ACTHN3_06305 [Solirubrobacterales bacterium]
MAERDYLEIKERVADDLLKLGGVHAVGVGAKVTEGEPTGEPAIKVFVEEKLPLEEVAPEDRVPAEVEGVKTDVVEMPKPTVLQTPGQLFGADRVDRHEYRPIQGGTQVTREGPYGHGTLGCLCTVQGDEKTVIALTNHHVVYDKCSDKPNHEAVGQPDGESSSSDCCDDIIGTVLDAQCDEEVDITLIKLKAGLKWLAEVHEIGRIGATHNISEAEANTHTYQVKKRGRTSGLTGGTVQAIGLKGEVMNPDGITVHRKYNNVISIVPNPDPASPGTPTDFSLPGDSGSAVLNAEDMVVGILFGGSSATKTTSGSGLAFPIKALIDKFAEGVEAGRKLELRVALAENNGEVKTVPTAMVADEQEERPAIAVGREIEAEISTSPQGRRYSDLFRRHREEAAGLVHGNRRVTLVWHRSGAAELFQSIVRVFRTPDEKVPAEIQGRPIRACVEDIAAALRQHGSSELASDLEELLPTLPDLAGLSKAEIVELLKGQEAGAAPTTV